MHTLHSLKRHLSSRKGFTLLELLIVLLIIGILIAIGLYRYQSVVDAARTQEDKANVRAAYINVLAETNGDGEALYDLADGNNKELGDGLTEGAEVDLSVPASAANDGSENTDGDFAVEAGSECMGSTNGNTVRGTNGAAGVCS